MTKKELPMAISQSEILEIFRASVPASVPEIAEFDRPLPEAGIDSLDYANFLLGLEERFGFKISDKEMESLVNMDDIIRFVNERVS
jgi:acyl carrier protein